MMIKEIAASHAASLDDWARQWSGDSAAGAAEVAFLMQRTARQIRRIIGETTDADAQSGTVALDARGSGEPLIGEAHRDQAEHRTELRD